MHILLIHQAFVSPDEAGGTRHYDFARRCVYQGHKFTIVASDHSYFSGKRNVEGRGLVKEQDFDGVRVLRAHTHASLHQSFPWRVFSFLSFMVTSVFAALRVGSVDVVMGTSPPIFQGVSAWLSARIRRKPFLLEIRDLWPEFAIDMGVLRDPLLISLSRRLEEFLYARATHILVNSPAYKEYLTKRGIAPSKITLIPNGVDTGMFNEHSDGGAFRRQWGLNGKFVVTYAGATGMANDLPTILRAAGRLREHPGIHFLIVGDGKERANLQRLATESRLNNVSFTGPRPKKEIAEILAASDACAATLMDIPMFRTTYPNKVFDYMAAGRPTILAIDGVIREVVESAGGGLFVSPGDDRAFADAVESLEKERERAKEMGRKAREYVIAHFDREKQSREFIRLVTAIAAGP